MKKNYRTSAKSEEPRLRPIKKTSLSEEIARQIMNLISTGKLKPGQRLPSERVLCERFGTSRSSLREALSCLSIVGVLHARVGEGTSVEVDGGRYLSKVMEWRVITEKHDIENLIEVRIALEAVSAANAAAQRTPEEIEALQTLIAKMKARDMDEERFAVLDAEFHVIIAKSSGNRLISDFVSVIRSQLIRAFSMTLRPPNTIPLAIEEHIKVLAAIERQNGEAARDAMVAHLKAALARYITSTVEQSNSQFVTDVAPKTARAKKIQKHQ